MITGTIQVGILDRVAFKAEVGGIKMEIFLKGYSAPSFSTDLSTTDAMSIRDALDSALHHFEPDPFKPAQSQSEGPRA